MVPIRHLVFGKIFNFLMADMVNRVNVYRHAEFHADGAC